MTSISDEILLNSMIVICLFFWGAWGICDKKALGYTSPVGQMAAVYCFAPLIALTLSVVLTLTSPGWKISREMILYESMGAVVYFVSTISYLFALSRAEASLILGATASYPVIAQILAMLFLNEPLSPIRLMGCCVAVVGIFVLGKSSHEFDSMETAAAETSSVPTSITTEESSFQAMAENKSDLSAERIERLHGVNHDEKTKARLSVALTILCVTVASIGWASRGIFDKLACFGDAHPLVVNLTKDLCDSCVGFLVVSWAIYKRNVLHFTNMGLWTWASRSALCLAGGGAAYFVALSKTSASYVIAITGIYPIVMYLLALFVLKEKFNNTRAIGIGLITIGGVLTHISRST